MLLASNVWVSALIRRAELGGGFASVTRRGDARAGGVLVKVFDTTRRTARVYAETTGLDGDRLWIRPIADEAEPLVDAHIQRQIGYDPDLWVVEIEDRQGRHFLTERVRDDEP